MLVLVEILAAGMEPVKTICHHRAAKKTRERLSSAGVLGLLRVSEEWEERISGRRRFWPSKSSSLVHEPQPRSACTEGVWCRSLSRGEVSSSNESREGAGQMRVVVRRTARWTRRARGRLLVVEVVSAERVRSGGAEQCLGSSQYYKNSERVCQCW